MQIIVEIPDLVCVRCTKKAPAHPQNLRLVDEAAPNAHVARDSEGGLWLVQGTDLPIGWSRQAGPLCAECTAAFGKTVADFLSPPPLALTDARVDTIPQLPQRAAAVLPPTLPPSTAPVAQKVSGSVASAVQVRSVSGAMLPPQTRAASAQIHSTPTQPVKGMAMVQPAPSAAQQAKVSATPTFHEPPSVVSATPLTQGTLPGVRGVEKIPE